LGDLKREATQKGVGGRDYRTTYKEYGITEKWGHRGREKKAWKDTRRRSHRKKWSRAKYVIK